MRHKFLTQVAFAAGLVGFAPVANSVEARVEVTELESSVGEVGQ